MKMNYLKEGLCAALLCTSLSLTAPASANECAGLPFHADLTSALRASISPNVSNGGFNLQMWASIVNRDGIVCRVTFSGGDRGDQWPASRVISAQKAFTANAFSLPGLAFASGNLYAATQPGGSMFGLLNTNPADAAVAYGSGERHGGGDPTKYGLPGDPMKGRFLGGMNVTGGGLPLYNSEGTLIGALGVSGDTTCADHNIAWRVRSALGMDFVPNGVGGGKDRLLYDYDADGESLTGFGHPDCGNVEDLIGESIDAVIIID